MDKKLTEVQRAIVSLGIIPEGIGFSITTDDNLPPAVTHINPSDFFSHFIRKGGKWYSTSADFSSPSYQNIVVDDVPTTFQKSITRFFWSDVGKKNLHVVCRNCV